MELSYTFGEPDAIRTRVLKPDDNGFYRVPLADRYSLPGVELELKLKALGLVYVKRPPDQMFELWRLRTVETVSQPTQTSTTGNPAGDIYVNGNLVK